MQGSRSTTGPSETHSSYGSTAGTSRPSSRPPSSRSSPSNIINVDEDNGNGDNDGNAARAQVTFISARRCRSVVSAPAQPSRSLTPFPALNYSQLAYTGSCKDKGDNPSLKGVKELPTGSKVCPPQGQLLGSHQVVASSCQEAGQAWRCSNGPWPTGITWNGPGKGVPRRTLNTNSIRCHGVLPRMTPNTINSSAKTFRSLTLSPISRGNGLIHARKGSMQRKTRISLAIPDTTYPLCSVQCPDGSNHHGLTIRERND